MVSTRVVIGSPACARSMATIVTCVAVVTVVLIMVLATAHRPALGADTVPENTERAGAPLPPEEARAAVTVRLPARLTLLASEPLIRNPVAATVDSAGRLLVAENLTYAERPVRTDTRWHDRVTLLEDADGDGAAERHAVLVDGLTGLTSLSVGRDGLWLLCPPRLLFIRDGHRPPAGWPDMPDDAEALQRTATAETVLDGFTVSPNSHHTFANGLSWGPDGWLYGRCGASSPGEIGPPGSAPGERVPLRGGMWRYHPERRVVEAICHGTTNPWGHDWDDRGEGFFVNTVNGHLWRILPGAHYARSHTVEPHPFVTAPLGHHADHQHFDDARHWTESRDGKADAHGGGHAHAGCVIVPDEPGWPGELRGRLLTLNLHGRRINVDRLDHTRQGIFGRHEDDLAIFGDPFFRGIDVVELPGRALAILDWSDTGECHEATGVHRTSGRVYRLGLGILPAPAPTADLADLPAADLVARLGADRWQARIALRLLADRHARAPDRPLPADARAALERLLREGSTVALRLRGLWGLWAGADLTIGRLVPLLDDAEPAIRTWAIRLLTDEWPLDFATGAQPQRSAAPAPEVLERLVNLASSERDPDVRLALATVLQRLPLHDRAALAAALVGHGEHPAFAAAPPAAEDDALPAGPLGGDHHDLGAMVWFGILPAIPADPDGTVAVWDAAALTGAEVAHRSGLRRWLGLRRDILRRATADDAADTLMALLGAAAGGGAADLDDCLAGLQAGWTGRRQVEAPPGWDRLRAAALALPHGDGLRADRVVALDATLDRPGASEALAALALDPALPVARRAAALDALADARGAGLAAVSGALLEVAGLEQEALRGLAVAGDPAGADRIVAALARFDTVLRASALQALVSRREWAATLATAVEQGSVPRTDLGPDLLRQVRAFRDAALDRRFDALVAMNASGEGRAPIDVWRSRLAAVPAPADPAAGRLIWQRRCASCHRLHGEGGTLGPDLTGSGRRDPDYLLAAIVTPSAVVSPDYRLRQVILTDGRVLAGLLLRRTREGIVLRSTVATETIATVDIDEVRDTGVSLMPEGLLDGLPDDAVRDLFAFLGGD